MPEATSLSMVDPEIFKNGQSVVAYSANLQVLALGVSREGFIDWISLVGFAFESFDAKLHVAQLLRPLLDRGTKKVAVKLDNAYKGEDTDKLALEKQATVINLGAGESCEITKGQVVTHTVMFKADQAQFLDIATVSITNESIRDDEKGLCKAIVHYSQQTVGTNPTLWHSGDLNAYTKNKMDNDPPVTKNQQEFIDANSGENIPENAQTVQFMGGAPNPNTNLIVLATNYHNKPLNNFKGNIVTIVDPTGKETKVKIDPSNFTDSVTGETVSDLNGYNTIFIALLQSSEDGGTRITNINEVSKHDNGKLNVSTTGFDVTKIFPKIIKLYKPKGSPGLRTFLKSLEKLEKEKE